MGDGAGTNEKPRALLPAARRGGRMEERKGDRKKMRKGGQNEIKKGKDIKRKREGESKQMPNTSHRRSLLTASTIPLLLAPPPS